MPGDIMFQVPKIPETAFEKRNFTFWNRLEPRARSDDFSRSIQARVYDPLWFLSRAWQVGEFRGEDAGSPIKAKLELEKSVLSMFSPGLWVAGSSKTAIDETIPLEIMVEREVLEELGWRRRVQTGQQLERILALLKRSAANEEKRQQVDTVTSYFKRNFLLEAPSEEERVNCDDATWRFRSTMAGRAIDGGKLKQAGLISENPSVTGLLDTERDIAVNALKELHKWHSCLYAHMEHAATPSWRHDQLEYEFNVYAPGYEQDLEPKVLSASDYKGGALDWYAFSSKRSTQQLSKKAAVQGKDAHSYSVKENMEMIPSNVSFRGMPNSRWWEFEDRQTDFGDLDAGTTDIGKLIVMEFALIHANDWFLIPVPLKIGTLCRINCLTVTDVFGISKEIQRAGSQDGAKWQKAWSMYDISFEKKKDFTDGLTEKFKVEDFFFLPPTLGRSEESPALEDVRFLRDEMANLVWAVEHTVRNDLGEPIQGYEYYRDRRQREEEQENRTAMSNVQDTTAELEALADGASAAAETASGATTPESLAAAAEETREKLKEIQRRAAEAAANLPAAEESPEESFIKYRLASEVPENWIPYIPVQTDQARRAIEFLRARLVSEYSPQGWKLSDPKTRILKSATDNHRIKEEAVSRAGTKIRLSVQRARWIDGTTHIWVGRRIGPGLGDGSSGLKFDYLTEK